MAEDKAKSFKTSNWKYNDWKVCLFYLFRCLMKIVNIKNILNYWKHNHDNSSYALYNALWGVKHLCCYMSIVVIL